MWVCDAVLFLSRRKCGGALQLLPELSARPFVVGNTVKAPLTVSGPWRDGPVVFAARFARTKGIATLRGLLPLLRAKRAGLVCAGGRAR
jgi:hypothetical protein